MKKMLLFSVLLIGQIKIIAQTNDQPFDIHYYADSIHSGLPKDTHGRNYSTIKLPAKKDERLFVYLTSTQFDVALYVQTPSGKWMTPRSRTVEKDFYNRPSFSMSLIDTLMDEDGDYSLIFTSATSGGKGKFMVEVAYANKENLRSDSIATDFCSRIGFLLKHAQVGFRLMRVGRKPLKDTSDPYYPTYYPVTLPPWFGDPHQHIETCQYCDAYRYATDVYKGNYTEAQKKYNELKEQLKTCFGTSMEYLEKRGITGYFTFTASMKGDDPIIKSYAAKRKDVQFEFNIALYGEAGMEHAASVKLDFQNHYEPIE